MSEENPTQTKDETDNALVRNTTGAVAAKPAKAAVVYDAEALNRFEFTVREGVNAYETAHVFQPLGDERYMQWLRELKVKGNEDDVSEESREASCSLWDELINAVEKITYPEGQDFRTLIPNGEKIESINAFLSVAIAEDLIRISGDRDLGTPATTITVKTEAFFNGDIATQSHVLQQTNFEWQKKYSRIQAKRFKQENTRGLRRKPKIEFIPQDHKLGELYDEMFVSQEGFAAGNIPLRFKTTVVHHLFEEKLDQKKSER